MTAAKPNTKKDADEARLKAGTPAERCAVVLELLGKRQDGFWFAEPVTDEIAPGYSDEIETPMDYHTAAEKLAPHAKGGQHRLQKGALGKVGLDAALREAADGRVARQQPPEDGRAAAVRATDDHKRVVGQ